MYIAPRATSRVTVAAAATPSSAWGPASGAGRPAAISRSAVRATAGATVPPPIELAAAHGPHGDEDRFEPIVFERREREVPAQARLGAKLDAHAQDGPDLRLEDLPPEPV